MLGKVCWLKRSLATDEWLEELQKATRVFRGDENELAFLLGWGKIILSSGAEATFIKKEIDKLIREELKMSSTAVLRKVLQAWDVPPAESKIIVRVLEGLDAEQRRIVLAALEGLDDVKKQVLLRMLELPSEKLRKLARVLEDPTKLDQLLDSLDG